MASPSPDQYRRTRAVRPRPDPAPPNADQLTQQQSGPLKSHAIRMQRVYGLLVRDLQRAQAGTGGANTLASLKRYGVNPKTPIRQLGKLKVRKG